MKMVTSVFGAALATLDRSEVRPAKAADIDEIIDFIFDLFDLLNLILDVLRNFGNYLSGV